MSSVLYKRKISQSLDNLDAKKLKQAWLILKEILSQEKMPAISNKQKLVSQLAKGIQQLDYGEGTDMRVFITGLKKKYGKE